MIRGLLKAILWIARFPERRLRLPRRVWSSIAVGCALLGLAATDLLGLRSASQRASEESVLRLLAPFYPSQPKPITVVLIDDHFFPEVADARWPLPYGMTRKLLHTVMCAAPRAVFVDLLFTMLHDRPERFATLREYLVHRPDDEPDPALCANMAPIYVADELDQAELAMAQDSVLLDALLTARPHRLPVSWIAEAGHYPLALQRREPAEEASPRWRTEHGDLVPTPATQLYFHYLRDQPERDAAGQLKDLVDRRDTMVVGWGLRPQAGPAGVGKVHDLSDCRHPGEGWLARGSEVLRQLNTDLMRLLGIASARMPPCPYSFWLPAHYLFTAGAANTRIEGPWRQLFHDRIVLIGASVTGAPDVALSPVHGQIPAVFLHAMALDNLIQWGDRYWRVARIGGFPHPERLVELLLFSLLVVVHGWIVTRPELGPVADAAIQAALVCAVTAFCALVLNWAPINWLGLLGLAACELPAGRDLPFRIVGRDSPGPPQPEI